MVKQIPSYSSQVSSPGAEYVPITKADANLPDGECRSLLVATAGTLNLMDLGGAIRTGVPVQAGFNPLQCRQVRTGGTADGLWAIY